MRGAERRRSSPSACPATGAGSRASRGSRAEGKAISDGFHTLTIGLAVKGAPEAIDWYKRALGATELMRMMSPDGKLVMHAELKFGDSMLFLHDEMPDRKVAWPKGKEQPLPQLPRGRPARVHPERGCPELSGRVILSVCESNLES
jgi:hypothetical protein